MVVTPGATAYLLSDRFPNLLMISVAIGSLTSGIGAYISYFLDGATGGVIVLSDGSRQVRVTVDWLTGKTSIIRAGR